jgi:dTDP-4-amino-4,6-dideoxygalactose transaminase
MRNVYRVTLDFEEALERYTGAPYAVAVDNCSNALFLALKYDLRRIANELEMSFLCPPDLPRIEIPARTYPSVPCAIIHAGAKVKFHPVIGNTLKGAYQLFPTRVWDSALRFTREMYLPNTFMCLSFTGPHKHLKLGKGGAILTDDGEAYQWFRRARFSGRNEVSYHEDKFDRLGWNFYMMPELAARGLLLMSGFYNMDGSPKDLPDIELPYPDLSVFPVYTQ